MVRYLLDRKCPLPTHSLGLATRDTVVELLLEAGADPNQLRPDGKPVIFGTKGHVLRLLLDYGADINVRYRGSTPLHEAIEHQCDSDVVELLLQRGADPSIRNRDDYDALQTAIHCQNLEAFSRLSPTWEDVELMGALLPIRHKNPMQLSEALWKRKVSSNYEKTCLETAKRILGPDHPSYKRLRVEIKIHWLPKLRVAFEEYDILSPEVADQYRNLTHDHFRKHCIEARHHELFRVFVPALLNASPLSESACDAYDDLVRLAVTIAKMWDVPENYLRDLAGLTLKRNGNTFLHCICETDIANANSVAFLIDRTGADVNARNFMGETPLHIAIRNRVNCTMIGDLFKRGADPFLKNNMGRDAMQLVVLCKYWTVFRQLIKVVPPRDKQLMGALLPICHCFTSSEEKRFWKFTFDTDEDYWTYCLETAERLLGSDHPTFRNLQATIGDQLLLRRQWSQGFSFVFYDIEKIREVLFWNRESPAEDRLDILRVVLPTVHKFVSKGLSYDSLLILVYNIMSACSPSDDLVRDTKNLTLNWTRHTFLHHSILKGDDWLVAKYLNAGADVNAVNADGDTPLHMAIREHRSYVKTLLEHGANPSLKNHEGHDALQTAVLSQNLDAFELFSPKPPDTELIGALLHSREESEKLWDLHFDTDEEFFARCVAVAKRHLGRDHRNYRKLVTSIGSRIQSFQFFIEHLRVTDVEVLRAFSHSSKDKEILQTILPPLREAPAWIATRPPYDFVFPDYDRILKDVLDGIRNSAHPEEFLPDLLDLQFLETGDSILHYALKHDWMVKEVLEEGANPNIRNFAGDTPLHLAQRTDTRKLLIHYGAHPDQVDGRGKRPPCEKLVLNLQCLVAHVLRQHVGRYHVPKPIKKFIYIH